MSGGICIFGDKLDVMDDKEVIDHSYEGMRAAQRARHKVVARWQKEQQNYSDDQAEAASDSFRVKLDEPDDEDGPTIPLPPIVTIDSEALKTFVEDPAPKGQRIKAKSPTVETPLS